MYEMTEQPETPVKSGQPMVRITTLGDFLLFHRHNGAWKEVRDKDLSARGPSLTLLKVLLCSGSGRHPLTSPAGQEWERHEASRDRVIDALWPEEGTAPMEADRALSVAKSVLNRALRPYTGADVVLLTNGSDKVGYRLNAPLLTLDADEFELSVAQACEAEGRGDQEHALRYWETAYALVQGEFLPHDQYNDWSTRRRDRLSGKYRLTLHRLAQLSISCGRTTQAAEILHPYVLAHPTDLDVVLVLLPLLCEQRRYEEAGHLLHTCQQACQEAQKPLPAIFDEIRQQLRHAQEEAFASLSRTPLFLSTNASGKSSTPALVPESGRLQTRLSQETSNGLALVSAFPSLPRSQEQSVRASAPWFDLKQQLIQALVTQWYGRAMYCDELQAIIDQELRMFDRVKSLSPLETYSMSRRNALKVIAALPLMLSPIHSRSHTSLPPPEEFLPACAASITSCWSLLNGESLSVLEETLPLYLPALLRWAQHPSRYQQTAAALASQACLLMDLVSYHRFRFQDSLSYATQAVGLAQVSGDHNLQVYALVLQGGAFHLNGHTQAMLLKHQEAEQHLHQVVPALQSYALAELAYAYAQNGEVQAALQTIGEARTRFPGEFGEVPCYVSADYGLFQLIAFEGMTHLALGEQDPDHTLRHTTQAGKALAQIEELPPEMLIPERLRVEIVTYQAQAALGIGNLDDFEHYLLAGAHGAQALGSEKRRQEVRANVKAAKLVWPQETRIHQLAEAIM